MPTPRPARLLAGAMALLVGGIAAAAGPTGGLATAHAEGEDPGRLVLVLDSSGSMKEPASGGETKIAAAKTALRTVIGGLPVDQLVGLRVYGATVFDRSDAGACTDSQLEVPVAADNRDRLRSAVDSYQPYGETPIGYALQQAGADVGTTGKRSIVLVSDGEPTCAPDPCEVARELTRSGIDLRIDVVGLDVKPGARGALQCIAAEGGGTYYDASGSADLAASLQKVATRAARPYAAIGRPVDGGTRPDRAPVVTAGDWLDRTNGSESRYYTIEREQSGSTVHFSAAFRDPDTTVFNTVALSTPEGDSCGVSGTVEQLATNTLISSAANAGPVTSLGELDAEAPCATSPTLVAKVTYSGRTTGVPVEIRVTELPRVDDVASLPRPVEKARWVAPPTGTAQRTQGGASFDDAPLLEGGVYRDDIVQGETLTYQVDLDWGQQLSALVAFPELRSGPRKDATVGEPLVKVSAFSPARADAGSAGSGIPSSQGVLFGFRPQRLGTVVGPVAFLNTSANDAGLQGASVAGSYTVTVFLAKEPGGRSIPVPFRMSLGVSGTPEGEPVFASASASASASPSAEVSPSPSVEADRTDGTTDASAAAEGGGDGGGGFPTSLALGGLGALALGAAAALTLRSRRATPGHVG